MQDYQAPADLLKERIIMVTGAGSGIGRAAAKTYAAHGATVILVGRTVSKLESVYDEIEAAGHPKPAIVPLNFEGAAVKEYEELAMTIEDNFDRIDGLLHNAAILGTRSPIELYDPEIWNKVMHVNATAPFLLSRAMIPLLRKSDDASVIFTASGKRRRRRDCGCGSSISLAYTPRLGNSMAERVKKSARSIVCIGPATRLAMRIVLPATPMERG